MANNYTNSIMSDTNKRFVIKLTGKLDANGESSNTKIIGRNITGALAVDANNMVLVANGGVPRSNYRYTIARIVYDINFPIPGYMELIWEGANTSSTLATISNQFDLNMQDNLGNITNTANGATGNIIFNSVGSATNSSYNIVLEIHKDLRDYNAGQIQRPQDFNLTSTGKSIITP